MNTFFARGMTRATELTRTGRLDEATALIRALLHDVPAASGPGATAPDDAEVIEGRVVRPGDAEPSQTTPAPRTGLAETLRRIGRGGMPGRGATEVAVLPDLPDGARFLSLTHRGPQGSRDYRLYIPARETDEPMPLVVMLHGCTQTPEDFAAGTGMNALAEEAGCLVVWPAQPQGANAQKCWNWFRPEDQARDRGEPALLAGIVRDILRDHPADPTRIYVAGLSAGGAAAAILGAAYPDLFAAVGVHSGLPAGVARDAPSAFAAMRSGAAGTPGGTAVPTIVFHGSADGTVHPANGAAVVAQVLRGKPSLRPVRTSGTRDGGRSYRLTRHDDAAGHSVVEHWEIAGAGHAWSGGRAQGSYTDPTGPDASREMLRFFLQHRRT
ncbi:MAG: PHB depolymerase family esterase [Rhodobacteraceae bacterium]|jgi:poly(hydroxyalkanoate) depolymerase family esterase|nr:PHB depolymerase family esterase [Paracoccaceae bacterium]